MAHTFDTSLYASTGTTNPATMSYTCGAGTTIFALGITVVGATARVAGDVTFGGKLMTQIRALTNTEASGELWYLLNPSTGAAYTVSVPNAATSKTLFLRGVSMKAASGFTSAYDSSASVAATTANPSIGIIASANGEAIIQQFCTGLTTIPTIGNQYPGQYILRVDHGAYGSAMQWYVNPSATTVRMGYISGTSDDYVLITAAFKEISIPNQIKSICFVADSSINAISNLSYAQVLSVSQVGN